MTAGNQAVVVPVKPQPQDGGAKSEGGCGAIPKWAIIVAIVIGIILVVVAISLIIYFATKSSDEDSVSSVTTTPAPGKPYGIFDNL